AQWIREMQGLARRHPRRYASLAEAVIRMRDANPRLTAEQAEHLTRSGVIRQEDGTYAWKFDNFVRAVSPYLFNLDDAREIWSHITCPVLLVRGDESWAPDPEADGRAKVFRNADIMTIARAGHWVHHDQLEGYDAIERGFSSGDYTKLARGREAMERWRVGIADVAQQLRDLMDHVGVEPSGAVES